MVLRTTPTRPMVSEMREAYTARENRSRPRRSVPSRNSGAPGSALSRCSRAGNTPHNRYSVPGARKRTRAAPAASGVYTSRKVTGSRSRRNS